MLISLLGIWKESMIHEQRQLLPAEQKNYNDSNLQSSFEFTNKKNLEIIFVADKSTLTPVQSYAQLPQVPLSDAEKIIAERLADELKAKGNYDGLHLLVSDLIFDDVTNKLYVVAERTTYSVLCGLNGKFPTDSPVRQRDLYGMGALAPILTKDGKTPLFQSSKYTQENYSGIGGFVEAQTFSTPLTHLVENTAKTELMEELLAAGCALIGMSRDPQQEDFNAFSNSEYIVTKNGLWYCDSVDKIPIKLEFSEDKPFTAFLEALKFKGDRWVNRADLNLIQVYTKHNPDHLFNADLNSRLPIPKLEVSSLSFRKREGGRGFIEFYLPTALKTSEQQLLDIVRTNRAPDRHEHTGVTATIDLESNNRFDCYAKWAAEYASGNQNCSGGLDIHPLIVQQASRLYNESFFGRQTQHVMPGSRQKTYPVSFFTPKILVTPTVHPISFFKPQLLIHSAQPATEQKHEVGGCVIG